VSLINNKPVNLERVNKMKLANGNTFMTDIAMELGLEAIQIVKDQVKTGLVIIGVEFETCEDGGIINVANPIVSALVKENGTSKVRQWKVYTGKDRIEQLED
tara:strand:+ start:516 stop:821 length:306 start_codon:yes stop_codon:yes gene_type:complete